MLQVKKIAIGENEANSARHGDIMRVSPDQTFQWQIKKIHDASFCSGRSPASVQPGLFCTGRRCWRRMNMPAAPPLMQTRSLNFFRQKRQLTSKRWLPRLFPATILPEPTKPVWSISSTALWSPSIANGSPRTKMALRCLHRARVKCFPARLRSRSWAMSSKSNYLLQLRRQSFSKPCVSTP